MKGITDGHCHSRAAHSRCQTAYCISSIINSCYCHSQKRDMQLASQRIDNGSDQKGTEQSLCHCTKSINAVSFYTDLNVFPVQKIFYLFHSASITLAVFFFFFSFRHLFNIPAILPLFLCLVNYFCQVTRQLTLQEVTSPCKTL